MNYKVQSIIFDKHDWNLESIVHWIIENAFKIKKIDLTKNFFRVRQLDPNYLKKKGFTHYHNKNIGQGIELVLVYKEPIQVVENYL